MANKDLSLSPHNPKSANGEWWWYEAKGGIEIIIHPSFKDGLLKIKWSSLKAAMQRKDLG